jgi:hypothetical protein
MGRISKPSRKLLDALDALDSGAIDDSTSSSDSESSSSSSSSSLDSSDSDSDGSKSMPEQDRNQESEQEPSLKRRKVAPATSRVKRTRGRGKRTKLQVRLYLEDFTCDPDWWNIIVLPDAPKRPITYLLSIFSSKHMAKPKAKRGDPKSDFLRLDEDKEWDTVKAQVMAKIDSILKPPTIAYDDYNIMFTVPRYSPHPMPLDSEEKYAYLVEHALKAKSPSVKIIIEAKGSEKKKVSMPFILC